MSMALERERTVDAVRWVLVVLAVLTAWESARIINAAAQQRNLRTAAGILESAGSVLPRAEEKPDVVKQARSFFEVYADLIVAGLFAVATLALVSRMLFASPLLDFLYLESSARERRTMFGFLFTTMGLILQMGLLYAMVIFARPPDGVAYSGMVPILMVVYLWGGAVWMCLVRIGARSEDTHALRGFWAAFGTNIVIGAALAGGAWYLNELGKNSAATFHDNRLHNVSITAGAALLVCTLDSFLQGKLYGKADKASAVRMAFMIILLLAVLGAIGYMVYRTRPLAGI